MLERKNKYLWRHQIERGVVEGLGKPLSDLSGEEVFNYIVGTSEYPSDYKIADRYWISNTTVLQRINRAWAYPFTFLCAPFQYIKNGSIGWSDSGKFGAWILKITGYK